MPIRNNENLLNNVDRRMRRIVDRPVRRNIGGERRVPLMGDNVDDVPFDMIFDDLPYENLPFGLDVDADDSDFIEYDAEANEDDSDDDDDIFSQSSVSLTDGEDDHSELDDDGSDNNSADDNGDSGSDDDDDDDDEEEEENDDDGDGNENENENENEDEDDDIYAEFNRQVNWLDYFDNRQGLEAFYEAWNSAIAPLDQPELWDDNHNPVYLLYGGQQLANLVLAGVLDHFDQQLEILDYDLEDDDSDPDEHYDFDNRQFGILDNLYFFE